MTSDIRPRKSIGQHFLRDERVAQRIVEAIHPAAGDCILEIGPGDGALTKYLVQSEARLVLVDIDERAIAHLQRLYGNRAEIVHCDILTIDLATAARNSNAGLVRVVGNIPYYITSPILFHVLDHRKNVKDLTIMVQKDVAQRLAACHGSKEYGVTSVFTQLLSEVELLFDVQPGSFHPRPQVTSSVIRLTMREKPQFAVDDEAFFRSVVRTAFGMRRKTMRNSLRPFLQHCQEAIDAITLARRPEELSVGELASLANSLYRSIPAAGTRNMLTIGPRTSLSRKDHSHA